MTQDLFIHELSMSFVIAVYFLSRCRNTQSILLQFVCCCRIPLVHQKRRNLRELTCLLCNSWLTRIPLSNNLGLLLLFSESSIHLCSANELSPQSTNCFSSASYLLTASIHPEITHNNAWEKNSAIAACLSEFIPRNTALLQPLYIL